MCRNGTEGQGMVEANVNVEGKGEGISTKRKESILERGERMAARDG